MGNKQYEREVGGKELGRGRATSGEEVTRFTGERDPADPSTGGGSRVRRVTCGS